MSAWIGVDVGGKRTGLDAAVQRDAIGAAVTARQHTRAMTETIGEIVVPVGRW